MIFDQLVRAQIDELARGASADTGVGEQSEAFAQRASADRLAMESLAKTLTEPVKVSSLARVFCRIRSVCAKGFPQISCDDVPWRRP